MTTVTKNYSAAATITITLTSLGVDAWRSSAAVDNTTNKFTDAIVGGSIQVGAVTSDGTIEIYAYGITDDTNYSGGLDGNDVAITWGTTEDTSVEGFNNLFLLGVVSVDTTDDNNDIQFGPFSVAGAMGTLPAKWGVIMKNGTDIALHATGTNNSIVYKGEKWDSA